MTSTLRRAGTAAAVILGLASCGHHYRTAGTPPVITPDLGDFDRDGLINPQDRCPVDPEDADGFEDGDGCPDPDNDLDGQLDPEDQCPNDAEDADGFRDGDGCPDLDNDLDGQLDPEDQCPNEAEDADGFEDGDGCPDLDNDQDRIADDQDQCPNEPEVYNGMVDEDGCPDSAQVVVRTAGVITSPERVYFTAGSSQIREVSRPLLDALAAVLIEHPEITLLEVQGHAADPGPAAVDQRLSQERAAVVRDGLIERGVDGHRLRAVAYGARCPLAPGDDERNRRVELFILRRGDATFDMTVEASPTCQGGLPLP